MFRGSEKGLKEDPLYFSGSPKGEVKSKKRSMQMRLKLVIRKKYKDSRAYSD
jgi:hypothetical protein